MLFKTVLIGIGPSGSSRDALAAAGLVPLARRLLASAYPHSPVQPDGHPAPDAARLRLRAVELLEARRQSAGLSDAETHAIAAPTAAEAIKQLALLDEADLIILGSADGGEPGRITLGKVARGVLQGASCPVLIPPLGFADQAALPTRIGLAFDGSPDAERVLRFTASLAASANASLEVVQAIDLRQLPGAESRTHAEREALIAPVQERLDQLIAELPVAARGYVVAAPVHETLERLGERVDLIVCGSRSWGPHARISLGGTGARLMEEVCCPVLVVPRGVAVPVDEPDDEALAEEADRLSAVRDLAA